MKFSDFDNQADICEIVRALIAGGVIEGARLDNLTPEVVDGIDCPGESDESKFQIIFVNNLIFP